MGDHARGEEGTARSYEPSHRDQIARGQCSYEDGFQGDFDLWARGHKHY